MDNATRNLIQQATQAARRLVEQDYGLQLEGKYDIHPDGTVAAKPGKHLDERERIIREKLVSAIQHNVAVGASPEEAVHGFLREAAFTTLNRFVALKMMEARGLVQECVSKGDESSGYKEFLLLAPGLSVLSEQAYRIFIESIFDEIGLEVRVLFDRRNPASLLWPRRPALVEFFAVLNVKELKDVWAEDETIGWFYQYFNSAGERKAMREASQAPCNSRELAVRNQFFTPRYVVEFLADNTLGRIWYEMHKGNTSLKDRCRYIVRRPNEVFLALGETFPTFEENEANLSQEDLPKTPLYIEHRPKKDPRDLRVLDPACGSGHFLLYAFDLLERIYEEAWADPESPKSEITGRTLREEYHSLDDLRWAIPKLIVEHNVHGIDIDQRAVQIAALALWLRAQKTWKKLGIKAAGRPHIDRSNIVTAEPMPGEEDMRREFTSGLKPRVLGQLVDVVFDKMKLAGDAGSLLKIEEEIKDAVTEAHKQWMEIPKSEQQLLFPGLTAPQPVQQEFRYHVKGVANRFWEKAEDCILDALREYAERAGNGHAIGRRLFADDATRGFAFIDLCRTRYDVVLMNPPFGESSSRALSYLKDRYGFGRPDAYMCFVFRVRDLLTAGGRSGAITSRTFLTLQFFDSLRELFLSGDLRLNSLLDLGPGVLDGATVETCCHVSEKLHHREPNCNPILFINSPNHAQMDELPDRLRQIHEGRLSQGCYRKLSSEIANLPGKVFAYRMVTSVVRSFANHAPIDPDFSMYELGQKTSLKRTYKVRQGLIPGDQFRFSRLWHEVPAWSYDWCWASKGGDFSRYVSKDDLLISWKDAGAEMKAFAEENYGGASRTIKNEQFFFRKGVTFPRVSSVGLNARMLPSNYIFTDTGMAVIPETEQDCMSLIGFLNSRFADYCCNSLHPGRKFEIAHMSSLPLSKSIIDNAEIARIARESIGLVRSLFSRDEDKVEFLIPEYVRKLADLTCRKPHSLGQDNDYAIIRRLAGLQEQLNTKVYNCYKIPVEERKEITLDLQDGICTEAFAGRLNIFSQAFLTPEIFSLKHQMMDNNGEGEIRFFSYLLGITLGRWDVRIAMDPSLAPKMPEPFDPLPVCPPGMLVGPGGLPAEPGRIVSEEWLRARPDANTVPPRNSVKTPTIPDSGYPLRICWEGILVDDPGFDGAQPHRDDIIRRLREGLNLFWKDNADDIEQEAFDVLGITNLRDYFRKPSGFFRDHLKRYSKSRRKAPIYWRLSTSSGTYSVWLYCHRLTKETFYKVLNEYVNPKIAYEERDLTNLRQDAGPNPSASQRKEIDGRTQFLEELRAFRDEIALIAPIWNPNLNDGVIINYALLWRLVPHHRAWQKELKECWDSLVAGEYDWSHLAMHLWPERVVPKCADDLSLAIAHGLENVFWEKDAKGKWMKRKISGGEVTRLVVERTSSAVKASLNELLSASRSVENGKRMRKVRARSPSKGKV